MPTGPSERRWEGSAALLVVLTLLVAGLTGCSPFGGDDPPVDSEVSEPATQLDAELTAALRTRAQAVRRGDLPAFLDGVDPARPAFRARQQRYFLNLRELPLKVFGYRLEGAPTPLPDGRAQAVVSLSLQLTDYDAVPVRTPGLFTFRADDTGTWLLVDDRDRAFEIDNDIEPQPWDIMKVEVAQGDSVLGIFDARSIDAAYQIMAAVESGVAEIRRRVPLDWNGRVVVYALSDLRILAQLDDLPGGDPDRLDGVAFPVRGSATSPRLAGIRFMLHPRMIDRDDLTRDRLIRHELTHVAIGRRDDRVPTWLAEGLAEHVSVLSVPRSERMISRQALEAAQAGLDGLPADGDFNGPHSGANYGISWFACDYVAEAFGEDTLWQLFDAMRAGDGTSEAEQDEVLDRVLGMDSRELAGKAAQEIVDTFG